MGPDPVSRVDREELLMLSDVGLVVRTGRCTECGAKPETAEATATADAAEPITHCEWCGAEYPVPPGR